MAKSNSGKSGNPFEGMTELDIATQEIHYTPEEQAVRDAFVEQYVIDHQPINAAMRIGFSQAFAKKYAEVFLSESYVIKQISQVMETKTLQNEEFVKSQRQTVLMNLIREANYFGPGASAAARLAANMKLAELTGLEDSKGNAVSSGVMIVESITDPDTWQAKAQESQAQLKKAVKNET